MLCSRIEIINLVVNVGTTSLYIYIYIYMKYEEDDASLNFLLR